MILNEKASFICILVCQERLVAWECVGFKCCRHVCSWHYLMGNQLKTISSNIFLWSWWISLKSILGSMQDQLIGVHNASECMLVTTCYNIIWIWLLMPCPSCNSADMTPQARKKHGQRCRASGGPGGSTGASRFKRRGVSNAWYGFS